MSDLYKTSIYFKERSTPVLVLLSEGNAEVVGKTVVNQSTGYNLAFLNWATAEPQGMLVVNGRNIDYVTTEEYVLPS